nr:hypothetical protein [Legionella jordanis]
MFGIKGAGSTNTQQHKIESETENLLFDLPQELFDAFQREGFLIEPSNPAFTFPEDASTLQSHGDAMAGLTLPIVGHLESPESGPPRKRKAPDDSPPENTVKSNSTYSSVYRRKWVYLDLMPMTIPLKEKFVPESFYPQNNGHGRVKQPYTLPCGRQIIRLGYWYYLNSKQKIKYRFDNGEPVPAERITDWVKAVRQLDGRKIITEEAFFIRKFRLVSTPSQVLPREEVRRHLKYNPHDGKCYVNGQEVTWGALSRIAKSFQEQLLTTSQPLPSPSIPVLTAPMQTNPFEMNLSADSGQFGSVECLAEEHQESIHLQFGNNPQQTNADLPRPIQASPIDTIPMTPERRQQIENKLREIHSPFYPARFYSHLAYGQQRQTPTLFASKNQLTFSKQNSEMPESEFSVNTL